MMLETHLGQTPHIVGHLGLSYTPDSLTSTETRAARLDASRKCNWRDGG